MSIVDWMWSITEVKGVCANPDRSEISRSSVAEALMANANSWIAGTSTHHGIDRIKYHAATYGFCVFGYCTHWYAGLW